MPRRNKQVPHERYKAVLHNCTAKRVFKSQLDADRAADFAMLEYSPVELKSYQCDKCHQWHLTSVKKGK